MYLLVMSVNESGLFFQNHTTNTMYNGIPRRVITSPIKQATKSFQKDMTTMKVAKRANDMGTITGTFQSNKIRVIKDNNTCTKPPEVFFNIPHEEGSVCSKLRLKKVNVLMLLFCVFVLYFSTSLS